MTQARMRCVTADDMEAVLGCLLAPQIRHMCATLDLRYRGLSKTARDAYLLDVLRVLSEEDLPKAGPHRLPDWERGWSENLAAVRERADNVAVIPRYHGKHHLARWRQEIVSPAVPGLDYRLHRIVVDWAISEYLSDVDTIYEFGCGPAYHLLSARKFNAKGRLVGLDWASASQAIIREIVAKGIESDIEGRSFDLLTPDEGLDLSPRGGVLTVAALEQVGDQHDRFVDYLLAKRPSICVHLEPIDELLDQENLLDYLSLMYCRKRRYLSGFLNRLRQLEADGLLRVIDARRTYSGSYFIEGHSLVVWAPV